MRLNTCLLTAACAVGFLATAAAAPNHHVRPAAQDAGPTASSTLITTSIYLNVTDPNGLQRFVAETTTPDFNGLVRTSFGARIDYEFLRNLIFYVEPKYTNEDFPGTSRKDKVGKVSAGFDYLLNRNAKVGLRYDFIDRNSTLSSFTYDEHVVTFNVTTQY